MDDHDHGHDHHGSELSEMQVRVRALESILVEKGYVESAALDRIVEAYETKIGPHIGARLVARAWVDPAFKKALLTDVGEAAATIGITDVGDHVVAVENTDDVHHVVVCTLCSCYPWSVLGLPPTWYKSAPYRSRTVKDPRGVLAEFGTTIPADKAIRVWDSTSEVRFIVLPQRPAGTDHMSEDQLAALVSRDAMIGVALAGAPA